MREGGRRLARAMAALLGTVFGAGLFGVPFVISRVGFVMGIAYFLVLGVAVTLLHLYFAEIVLAVRARHRFPGFAEVLLGRLGKTIAGLLGIVGGWLALVVYLILGGIFLSVLLTPFFGGTERVWAVILALVGAVIVSGGLRGVGRAELVLTGLLLVALLIIVGAGVPHFDLTRLATVDWSRPFLPYGVILFALLGLAAIPDLEDMLGNGKRRELRRVIIWGGVITTVLTALFGVVIAGMTGQGTTPEAITGLAPILGGWVVAFGALFGFLAVITSFLVFLIVQVEQLTYDYRMARPLAGLLALGVPLALYLIGARNFIDVLGFTGGVFGGLTGVFLVIMYMALLRKRRAPGARWIVPSLVLLLFFIGAIAEFLTVIHS